jgi:hypothetical protein
MARYRFHCTNGLECILDTVGTEIRASDRIQSRARQVASDVMSVTAGRADWSDWRVTVHDLEGRRVLLQFFVPCAERHPALAA